MIFLNVLGGIVSYEFQSAQQILAMRLMWANGRASPPTPPGMLGSISSVPFGVPLPNVTSMPFQKAMFGIMCGLAVCDPLEATSEARLLRAYHPPARAQTFHAVTAFMPVKRMNTLAIWSFIWLVMAASVMMFALPAVTPASTRNGAKFIFTEWIPSSASAVSATATALAPAPAFAPPLPPAGGSTCGLNTTVNTACGTYTLLPNCTMPSSFAPSCQQAVAANVGLVTNLPSEGWNAMVGLLMTQYLMTYYDVPSHMAEETHDAARTVRLAVWHTTRFLRFSRPGASTQPPALEAWRPGERRCHARS